MAAEIRRGTLERVPRTPPELSRTNYYCRNPALVPGSSLLLALLHGGWDAGCCRIGLAASAGSEEPKLTFPRRPGQAPPIEHYLPAHLQCRFPPSPGDARGEAPGKTNLWSPPSRREERSASAGRGDRGRKNSKGRADRQPPGQAPAGVSLPPRPPPVPRRHSRRGAGGEAPGKTNLWSPPSRREGGRGDGGRKVS